MRKVISQRFLILSSLFLLLVSNCVFSAAPTEAELEAWFLSDEPDAISTASVNEGQLTFLAELPNNQPTHHHFNEIWLDAESLKSGWARLHQCHENLDQVPRLQIAFGEGRVKALQVVETKGIEDSWVKGNTVQVRSIGPNARLCLTAETRSVNNKGEGYFTVSNGPYMRRFLDGYYPMQVSMVLNFPPDLLELVSVFPAHQPGFEVDRQQGRVMLQTLFEGTLRTSIQLQLRD